MTSNKGVQDFLNWNDGGDALDIKVSKEEVKEEFKQNCGKAKKGISFLFNKVKNLCKSK